MNTQNAPGISGTETLVYTLLLMGVGLSCLVPGLGYGFIGLTGALFAYRRGKRMPWGNGDNALVAANVALIALSILF